MKKIHEKTKENIEKMTEQYTRRANKGRKKMLFEEGDCRVSDDGHRE